MNIVRAKLTVLFQNPFWVGIFERESERGYEAVRIVFGAEPKDYEVYDYMLQNQYKLRFGPSLKSEMPSERKANPKRIQRKINREISKTNGVYVGTKAQQAMKLLQEQGKAERQTLSREQKLLDEQRKFDLRQERKKEKHKGH